MDRNSIIGLVLVFLILIGYMVISQPSEAELALQKRYNDSIALVNKANELKNKENPAKKDSIVVAKTIDTAKLKSSFGGFADQSFGENKIITLENKEVKIDISSKGAMVSGVQLKNHKRADSSALILFNQAKDQLSFTYNGNVIFTGDFYWQIIENTNNKAKLRLYNSSSQYIEFEYNLPADGYNLDKKINLVGLNSIIQPKSGIALNWEIEVPKQEYEIEKEQSLTTVYFKQKEENTDYINETKYEEVKPENPLEWVSFKQQFFNSSLHINEPFLKESSLRTKTANDKNNVKNLSANLVLNYQNEASKSFDLTYYFGPNHYKILKSQKIKGLDKIIPLGWGIFGWINRFMIIPIFTFLSGFMSNYGIIILLLTLIIKTILLPLVYKSYKSTAKMRLLKPELDEIKEKHKDNMQASQMENLALYKKAGVNPFGGCLPMLLQMPILVAVFQFVPSAFEFRQQSFLWATDLSHFDSILNFGKYPIIDTIYGSHISLFTLLMTISTLIYTRLNNQITGGMNEQMKWISYLMPIMFLGFFNKYPAALSYYYFLSNCVTFTQQWAIKFFVDENKLRAQINESKNKTGDEKKSAFQKKMEEMAKSRGLNINPPNKK